MNGGDGGRGGRGGRGRGGRGRGPYTPVQLAADNDLLPPDPEHPAVQVATQRANNIANDVFHHDAAVQAAAPVANDIPKNYHHPDRHGRGRRGRTDAGEGNQPKKMRKGDGSKYANKRAIYNRRLPFQMKAAYNCIDFLGESADSLKVYCI